MRRKNDLRRRSTKTTSNSYQEFEPRRMLAGDVTAFMLDGNVYIRGDAENNQVEVVFDEHGAGWVKGIGDTTVNGNDFRQLLHTRIEVNSDQSLTTIIDGGLKAHMGPGHDYIRVVNTQFEDLSVIYGGTGNDRVEIEDATFTDRITVQTFDGNDSITSMHSDFQSELFVFGLEGNDKVMLDNTNTHSTAVVVTGNGNDTVQVVDGHYLGDTHLVLTGDGDDIVGIDNPQIGDGGLGVYGGQGSDDVTTTLHDGSADGMVVVNGQLGGDTIEMNVADSMEEMVTSIGFEDETDIVFDNGVGGALNVNYAATSYYTVKDNHRIANDFAFESDTTVTSIDWTGTYAADLFTGNQDPYAVDDFIIEFYEGNEYLPIGDPIASFDVGNDVDREAFDPFIEEHMPNWTTYQYSADVDVTFEAGKIYWVSIYSTVEDFGPPNEHGTWGNHFVWGSQTAVYGAPPNPAFEQDVTVYNYGDEVRPNHRWDIFGGLMDFQLRS